MNTSFSFKTPKEVEAYYQGYIDSLKKNSMIKDGESVVGPLQRLLEDVIDECLQSQASALSELGSGKSLARGRVNLNYEKDLMKKYNVVYEAGENPGQLVLKVSHSRGETLVDYTNGNWSVRDGKASGQGMKHLIRYFRLENGQ